MIKYQTLSDLECGIVQVWSSELRILNLSHPFSITGQCRRFDGPHEDEGIGYTAIAWLGRLPA